MSKNIHECISIPALALASFECEHPENQFEKERYKSLKYVSRNICRNLHRKLQTGSCVENSSKHSKGMKNIRGNFVAHTLHFLHKLSIFFCIFFLTVIYLNLN